MRTYCRMKLDLSPGRSLRISGVLSSSRAYFSHRRVYRSTAHVSSSEAPSRFAKDIHVHPGSGFQPVSNSNTKRGRRTNHNPDVLIRIKRNLNDTEEAMRSATLGADLTHVASLAESFSQLRSRANAVKSDLVDALDREGRFFFFSPSSQV